MTDLEPLQVPIKHAAHMLGVCRETLYRMRKDNEITFGRFRGRAMVPMAEIKRVHAQLYPQPQADPDNITQQPVGEPVGEPKKCRPKKVKLFPQLARL
jgi:hypothetical protein